jgi:hypothetical protein
MKRRTFIQITVGATVSSARVAVPVIYCRSCASKAPDGIHLIDTHLPYGPDRDRTVCFSCEPRLTIWDFSDCGGMKVSDVCLAMCWS